MNKAMLTPDIEDIESKTYKNLFKIDTLEDRGFQNISDFMKSVLDARLKGFSDERLKDLTEGVPSSAGFVVPSQFSSRMLDVALEQEIVRPRASVYMMDTDELTVPAWTIGDHSSNLFGGISVYTVAEGGTITKSTPTVRQIKFSAKKVAAMVRCSAELLADRPDFREKLSDAFTAAMAWYLDEMFLNGNGGPEPLGVLNSPCKIEVSGETGQAADTICYDNLVAMFARLHPASHRRATWVANLDTLPQLLKISIPFGAGGQFYPVMNEANGQYKIFGLPLILTEKLPTLGDANDIILADFSTYAIGLRKEVYMESSNGPAFSTDEIDYKFVTRIDAKCTWNEALTPKNSSDTLSPIITLGARA